MGEWKVGDVGSGDGLWRRQGNWISDKDDGGKLTTGILVSLTPDCRDRDANHYDLGIIITIFGPPLPGMLL